MSTPYNPGYNMISFLSHLIDSNTPATSMKDIADLVVRLHGALQSDGIPCKRFLRPKGLTQAAIRSIREEADAGVTVEVNNACRSLLFAVRKDDAAAPEGWTAELNPLEGTADSDNAELVAAMLTVFNDVSVDNSKGAIAAVEEMCSIVVRRIVGSEPHVFSDERNPVVVVECGAEWSEPMEKAWREAVPRTSYVRFKDNERHSNSWGANAKCVSVIDDFRPLVVSCADMAHVSPLLVDVADVRTSVEVRQGDLEELYARMGGDPAHVEHLSIDFGSILPLHLTLAWRNRDPKDFLESIRRLLDKSSERHGDSVKHTARLDDFVDTRGAPELAKIRGMGAAVQHGLSLVEDVALWRKGNLRWEDVYGSKMVLSGPPGTGKTTYVRALAKALNAPLLLGSYAIWMGRVTDGGQGAIISGMRKTFEIAAKEPLCVVGIDEIDSFVSRDNKNHNQEWFRGVVNALLQVTDQSYGGHIIVVGTCNDPSILDPALVRPGRLEAHIRIPYPSTDDLADILQGYLPHLRDEDLRGIAADSLGATGADVDGWVRAATRAARAHGGKVSLSDLRTAVFGEDDRSEQQLMHAAIHEAGHAVAACVLSEDGGGLESVSIRLSARHLAGGGINVRGPSEAHMGQLLPYCVMLMCGRAAEERILGHVTGGSGGSGTSDLARLTLLAANGAASIGLVDGAGLHWRTAGLQPEDLDEFLSRHRDVAAAAESFVQARYKDALRFVDKYKEHILVVGKELIERKSMSGARVRELVRLLDQPEPQQSVPALRACH